MSLTEQARIQLLAALKNNTAYTEIKGALDMMPWTSAAGLKIGNATTDKVGFYGTTPITQRVGAAQAAVTTTGSATTAGVFGYTTSTQADGIVTLVNELRAAMVALGLIKGAA